MGKHAAVSWKKVRIPEGIPKIAAAVAVAIVAAGAYYLAVNLKSMVSRNPKRLELYYRHAKRFTDEQKAGFLRDHAGLWLFQSYSLAGGVPLKRIDRLEFKDNGIVWQAVEWDVTMPSGKQAAFYQIRTGYLEPYGTMGSDSLGDFYTIHQSFITGVDTCFGGWNFVDLWKIRREGASLVVSKRMYEPYKGEPSVFFPEGMLDLVGLGGGSGNKFIKKTNNGSTGAQIELLAQVPGINKDGHDDYARANALALPDCLDMNGLGDVFKKTLFGEFAREGAMPSDSQAAAACLERYFKPLIIYERYRLFPRPVPSSAAVSFFIRTDGTTDSVQCTFPGGITDRMLHDDVINELKTWRFPALHSPLHVANTFSMP